MNSMTSRLPGKPRLAAATREAGSG
jgi:hypothetical protein